VRKAAFSMPFHSLVSSGQCPTEGFHTPQPSPSHLACANDLWSSCLHTRPAHLPRRSDLPSNEPASTTKREGVIAGGTRSSSGGRSGAAAGGGSSASILTEVVKSRSSDLAAGIIVILSRGLNEVQWDCWKIVDVLANDDRSNNQNDEQNQQGEVQDCVANHTSLSEARLLEGVDGWPNLTARS